MEENFGGRLGNQGNPGTVKTEWAAVEGSCPVRATVGSSRKS